MNNLKQQLVAVKSISEKVLLLLVGAAALAASVLDPRFETLKLGLQVLGAVCFLLGISPMVWQYVKAQWPKADTKKK